ncbi:hypothetical protein L1049_008371 [Liquidambar formosana]|uniref:Copper transport protein n=1 Tax=Liquidambar formosana TaxID=63359 RepID=A0AAP0S3J5_LIQFO
MDGMKMPPPGSPPPGSMPHDGMNNMDMPNMGTMHTSFFWSKDVIILFPGWPDHSLGMYILALFFVFLLSAGVEVLSISPAHKPGMSPMMAALMQATVYALRMGLAYLVMLTVMSYNLGIFIVVVAGHAVGFFLVKYRALAMAGRAQGLSFSNLTSKV